MHAAKDKRGSKIRNGNKKQRQNVVSYLSDIISYVDNTCGSDMTVIYIPRQLNFDNNHLMCFAISD